MPPPTNELRHRPPNHLFPTVFLAAISAANSSGSTTGAGTSGSCSSGGRSGGQFSLALDAQAVLDRLQGRVHGQADGHRPVVLPPQRGVVGAQRCRQCV